MVDLYENKLEGLAERIQGLLDFFQRHNHNYDEALGLMLLAETYLALGKKKEMVAPVLRVLDLSARYDYEYWLKNEIHKNRAIFEHEDILEKLPPDLREELLASQASPAVPVLVTPAETAPITDLTVKVLGHAEIYRDPSRPFAADAWTTRKARDIFCYIATRKHRRVAKEVLIEAFWGDEDLATVEKNFHPTISHIRKALNSRQALKQNFIVFRDGAYQLNPEFSYSIDTEDFLDFVAAAETAKRENDAKELRTNLESAYGLYRGEFMDGSYEDWAEEQRHFYREQFSRVLNGLAKLSVAEKRWADALKFANEILKIDPYREDLHRLVLKVLAAQSKTTAVKKHYEDMQTLLKSELGIDPAPETRRLFQELVK
jgi:DNA-binding SARP family transcriptional activator